MLFLRLAGISPKWSYLKTGGSEKKSWHNQSLSSLRTALITIIRLIKQEIRRQLLVLVAGEVGLDDEVALEAQTA